MARAVCLLARVVRVMARTESQERQREHYQEVA